MQLHLMLAQVQSVDSELPDVCPKPGCDGTEFRLHQQLIKPLRDAVHQTVTVYRYQCLRCGRTFRVYPQGVSHAHTSQQVQDLAVLLYLLGLSFGAVSSALDGLGIYLSKSRVYDAVQSVRRLRPELTRCFVFQTIQRRHLQRGVVYVQCMQQWLPLSLMTNERSGLIVTVTALSASDTAIVWEQMNPLVTALDGQLLIADAYGAQNESN